MKLSDFLKERISYIISMSLVLIISVAILCIVNPAGGPTLSLLTGTLYILGTIGPLSIEYLWKKDFYNNLYRVYDSLDRKNLIAELITPPNFREGIILNDILSGCNKAMLEEINKYRFMQEEYREYIELWVHEVKTPISSSRLIAHNNKTEVMDSMSEELYKIEALVEQVLFYSRSSTVEKDYLIKEINLQKLVCDILKKNSNLFIQKNVGITMEAIDLLVYSDEKWLNFILSQILTNSVKYINKSEPIIGISAVKSENSITLSIKDNGIGIKESELPRIFDKGFTGTNGRKNERSTGMGLYLCKKLCDKLGLAIKAASVYGEGTTISIAFPKSSMLNIR